MSSTLTHVKYVDSHQVQLTHVKFSWCTSSTLTHIKYIDSRQVHWLASTIYVVDKYVDRWLFNYDKCNGSQVGGVDGGKSSKGRVCEREKDIVFKLARANSSRTWVCRVNASSSYVFCRYPLPLHSSVSSRFCLPAYSACLPWNFLHSISILSVALPYSSNTTAGSASSPGANSALSHTLY